MDDSNRLDPTAAYTATPEPVGAESGHRFRGKNRNGRWKREEGTEPAVIRLPLDVHPDDERELEQLFSGMWTVSARCSATPGTRSTRTGPGTSAARATRRRGGGNSA
jgi:hypothetical protein